MSFNPESYGAKRGDVCPYCGSWNFEDVDYGDTIYGYENLQYEPTFCKCNACGKEFVIFNEYALEHVGTYVGPLETFYPERVRSNNRRRL